jgi:hypothetical protein
VNIFAELQLPHADELKALAEMKLRGLFPHVSWPELCALLTGHCKRCKGWGEQDPHTYRVSPCPECANTEAASSRRGVGN